MTKPSTSKTGIAQNFKNHLRSRLRHTALTVLSRVEKQRTTSALRIPRVQNLYFHFLPEKDVDNFIALIRLLKRDHHFVSYSRAMELIQDGTIDRPYLSVSFDDGFESNRRAAELLAQEDISACFFICPDMVGKNRKSLEREFYGDIGEETRMMTWEEIHYIRSLGHEIGSHTLTHSVLATQAPKIATEEIVESKKRIEAHLGPIKHFAWPLGQFRHFAPELIDIVFDAGYESCASAVRGSHLSNMSDSRGVIHRENCVASWPIDHILYLLGMSTRRTNTLTGSWPKEWKN